MVWGFGRCFDLLGTQDYSSNHAVSTLYTIRTLVSHFLRDFRIYQVSPVLVRAYLVPVHDTSTSIHEACLSVSMLYGCVGAFSGVINIV